MAANVLIDTGAILAILDVKDPWHNLCMDASRNLPLPFVTTEAVLTELFHLIGRGRREMESAWKFIRSDILILANIGSAELGEVHALMSQYWDRPMDFADATLVHVARRENISTVFTADHSDFETYRIDGRRRFRIIPATRP